MGAEKSISYRGKAQKLSLPAQKLSLPARFLLHFSAASCKIMFSKAKPYKTNAKETKFETL